MTNNVITETTFASSPISERRVAKPHSRLPVSSTNVLLMPIAVIGVFAGGCAKSSGGDNYAKPLPAGTSCRSILSELRRMDAAGAQAKVEAVNEGRKVSSKSRATAARYNQLLDDYLGARCHAT